MNVISVLRTCLSSASATRVCAPHHLFYDMGSAAVLLRRIARRAVTRSCAVKSRAVASSYKLRVPCCAACAIMQIWRAATGSQKRAVAIDWRAGSESICFASGSEAKRMSGMRRRRMSSSLFAYAQPEGALPKQGAVMMRPSQNNVMTAWK